MERHRERMDIMLSGGKPWGFSIKGGTSSSNSPITVSKLEPYGKGEASGLRIGDIIICVNDVQLSGVRKEAVEMIRRSGDRLILAVERAFPMNTIEIPTQGRRPSPCEGYISDARYREPVSPQTTRATNYQDSNHHQIGWHNERNNRKNNNMNDNQPTGYVFSQNNSNKLRQQQVKETLKMVIEKKRDGLVNSPPDIIRDRLSDKTRRNVMSSTTSDPSEKPTTRRSMTSSSTVSDPSERQTNQPNSSGVRHRHGSKDSGERPRSWHASKHPEIEQELKQAGLSYADRGSQGQPAPRTRRKSREWLESEDLRSTLDRNSSESLLTSSSEQLLMENGEANPPPPLPRSHHGISRDRSSINSNPSLLDAFQGSPSVRSSSFDYESLGSALPHRSSQDSLNASFKVYRLDCPSSDSKNNVRIDGSQGNRLRSSGRYGEIWKMPQAHRRAKSFDALSDDTPRRQSGGGGVGGISRTRRSMEHSHTESHALRTSGNAPLKSPGIQNENLKKSPGSRTDVPRPVKSPTLRNNDVFLKSPGFQYENIPPKSPILRTENLPQKSPSPVRSRQEHSRFQYKSEKGRHVDALITNFEKSKQPNDDHKLEKTSEPRHFSDSKSIIKRLQQHHSTSSFSNFSTRQHDNIADKTSPTANKLPVQSSRDGMLGVYSERDDYKTLQSRSDEYRKNIQGMSKKVLRVTSFTRKDLELSPPYQNPVHQPKGFGFPPPLTTNKEGQQKSLSSFSNGPVRSKSTSSLLDTVVPSKVNIPVTREETNLLQGKQYCKSLSPPPRTISHINVTVEKPKDPPVHHEEVLQLIGGRVIKRITGPRNNGLTNVPELHCEDKNNEIQPPTESFNHSDLQIKSPPPIKEQYLIHDTKPATTAEIKLPSVTLKSEEDAPVAPETSPPPVTKPSSPSPLPTTQNTTALTSREVEPAVAAITSSSVTSSSYSDVPSSSSPLPATSAYYQTSASKAKIIHLIQEKFEGETIDLENIETDEERNDKKIELLKRITKKLTDLQRMKDMIKLEVNDNEQLGKTVKQLAEKHCTPRELERFKTFVEEIDKIFNLIFSISGRLARVENTLATLAEDADVEEKNGLLEKRRKLTLQKEEAISLKENVDRRQENVSKILTVHFTKEEYADFEHYIKMKTALISEQREVDDKMRLGEEQMSELHNSLPETLQEKYPLSEQYQAFKTPQEESQGSGEHTS